jgi:hypothetical protein
MDIEWQCRWFARMTENMADNPAIHPDIRDYYAASRENILNYHEGASTRPRFEGLELWYREEHQKKFLSSIRLVDGLYVGEYGHEYALLKIPEEWRKLF